MNIPFFGRYFSSPWVQEKEETEFQRSIKQKQIAKRRARNKVARKSRRINRMIATGKCLNHG